MCLPTRPDVEMGKRLAATQCTLMAAFSDVSKWSETSLSLPRIDNLGNDENGLRLDLMKFYCVTSLRATKA